MLDIEYFCMVLQLHLHPIVVDVVDSDQFEMPTPRR